MGLSQMDVHGDHYLPFAGSFAPTTSKRIENSNYLGSILYLEKSDFGSNP
jgi:hypothetical protein